MSDVFVCVDGELIVGMAYLVRKGNPTHVYPAYWCYVRMVSVHPEYRGNGICRQLMKQCIAKAIENGETVMALHTSEIMNDARHVYESMGFQLVKELTPVFGLRYWLFRLDI
ncbi:MAG: hypothetical protein JWQ38_1382 [Flavipsychrobacter sp.]|nr:hypothetical protein [Flavipsychrobacter sp.]